MHIATESVTMRDGVRLSTAILTPDTQGSFPTIIVRTPYSKDNMVKALSPLCSRGYAILVQDVRGTGESEGTFDILRQEPLDAVDTAAWLLSQPFCNGSLGVIGLSYLASASVAIASEFESNVKACVFVSPVVGSQGLFLENGALKLHHNLPWMSIRDPNFQKVDWRQAMEHLPLSQALSAAGLMNLDWPLMCQDWNKYWEGRDLAHLFTDIKAPSLHFAGFWDFMLDSAIMAYQLVERSSSHNVLVLGPWSHNGIASETTKNLYMDYGREASPRFSQLTAAWFDHWLKGESLPKDLQRRFSAFVPGKGWITSDSISLEQALENNQRKGEHVRSLGSNGSRESQFRVIDLYLAADSLDESPEAESPGASDEKGYEYDPRNPVPTEGGALWEFPKFGLNPGPGTVTTGHRKDVLVFRTKALHEPVTCLGPAKIVLFVGSDAPSTDFTAKIVDEDPSGTGRIVADTIYRWKKEEGSMITMKLPVVGHNFDLGHRIRLDISSSNFPKFNRNLNTGVSDLTSDSISLAHQKISFGRGKPSRITLTVL